MSTGLFVYLLIVITQISIDPYMSMCCNGWGKLIMAFHHCIQVLIMLGSLCFGFHEYHLYFTLFAFSLHILLNGCFLSKVQNKVCGLPEETPLYTLINHFTDSLVTKRSTYIPYYCLLVIVIIYDVRNLQ